MTHDPSWLKVRDIVAAALDLPLEERQDYLAVACGSDSQLFTEADSLLAEADRDHGSFLVPPEDLFEEVDLIPDQLGEFKILRRIGRGGMGVVYAAHQPSLHREVALKVLARSETSSKRIERLRLEARAVARLQHPGIVQVYTDGEDGDCYWFAMELAPGRDLGCELKLQRKSENGDRPFLPALGNRGHVAAVARVCADVAVALHHAHEHGLVHRDIKPANLLLGPDCRVRVADFGLARDQSTDPPRADEIAGTFGYMSPEHTQRGRVVDRRSDVFSLGVVLYEMLTLQRPFVGESAKELIARVADHDPPSTRSINRMVPRDLEIIRAKAMAKSPNDRYQTAAELADDLSRFLSHEAIAARPPSIPEAILGYVRRRRVILALAGGIALASYAGFRVAEAASDDQQEQRLVQPLQRVAGRQDWTRLPLADLVTARRNARELQGRQPSGATRRLLRSVQERFVDVADSWHERGLGKIDAGFRGRRVDDAAEVDDAGVLEGLFLLSRAAILFPERKQIAEAVSIRTFQPTLDVRAVDANGRAVSGTARYRALDPMTGMPGERVDLGELPVVGVKVPPGYYRIEVDIREGGLREFTRLLRRGRLGYEVEARVLPSQESTAGMRLIPGGVLQVPENERLCTNAGRAVEVPSFWIDEAEVSVGEYREFLRANPAVAKPWGWASVLPKHDALPVVYVSWEDARAYAEWRGKRLVAHAEWEWAARRHQARFVPWAQTKGEISYRGNTQCPYHLPVGWKTDIEQYLASARPVRSDENARTPDGLYHMLGNVAEWNESLITERIRGRHVVRTERRLILGVDWHAKARRWDLRAHEHWGVERNYAGHARGFRCGKSLKRDSR